MTKVNFGSASAAFQVVSATEVTATAPAGKKTVDVTVTGPGGTSLKVSRDRYSYLARPVVKR